jgi:hypothetical protein
MIAQGLLQPGEQVGENPLLLLALGLVRRPFLFGVEVYLALGYRLRRFAVELGDRSTQISSTGSVSSSTS